MSLDIVCLLVLAFVTNSYFAIGARAAPLSLERTNLIKPGVERERTGAQSRVADTTPSQ